MVPVAPAGRPGADTVTDEPLVVWAGDTTTVIVVSALMTVKAAPVAVALLSSTSPEYVAVTGYVAGSSVDGVRQLVVDSVAVHSAVLPEVNVTVPVAPAGRPPADTVSDVP